jgi:4-hydroxybenzoate polyprenyltransferase
VLLGSSPLLATLASWKSALALAAAIALGVAYSLPPIRLSGRPWISQLLWPVLGVITYSAVALLTQHWVTTWAIVYLAGVGFFYAVGEILAKDIRDWDNDRDTGKRTSVVALGPARAAVYSMIGCLVGSAFLTALLWWRPGMNAAFRVGGTALLALWLVRVAQLVARLRRRYDKDAARRLHVGYIRVYLAFNLCMVVDAWLRGVV